MVYFRFLQPSPRRVAAYNSTSDNRLIALLDPLVSPADWEAVADLALANPAVLLERDCLRQTPLFLALQRDAPPFVIQAFLQVCPEAAQEVQRIGLMPLHLAVSRGSDPQSVKHLLDACPQAASRQMSDGCVPLHFVRNVETARLLIQACPMALSIPNNANYLPLHRVAYASYSSPELVQLLVDAEHDTKPIASINPNMHVTTMLPMTSQLLARTCHGISPLDAACEMIERDLRHGDPVCLVKWNKLVILAKAAHDIQKAQQQPHSTETSTTHMSLLQEIPDDQSFSILNVLLQSINEPSLRIIRYILTKKHPEQRAFLDHQGRSALAIAASRSDMPMDVLHFLIRDKVLSKMATVMDYQGRVPLHLAAETGRSVDAGLKELWKAAPVALTLPDPTTGLYPCLLAATRREGDEGCSLDTIFSLLRETPWLIPRTVNSSVPTATRRSKLGFSTILRSLTRGARDNMFVLFCLFLPVLVAMLVPRWCGKK
jgi:ankyrin repeat protein